MATLVKKIHDLVDIAIDKGVTGYLSRPQIDAEIHAASMDLFRKLLSEFPRTNRSRNYLSPFQATGTPNVTNGRAAKPTGFEHEIAVTLDDDDETEVDIVEEDQWSFRIKDPVDPPTVERPVCCFRKTDIGVRPTDVTKIKVTYFRKPVAPIYGTIPVNGRPIYNEPTTTDVEWSELLHNRIRDKALAAMGINLREIGITQASQGMDNKDRDL